VGHRHRGGRSGLAPDSYVTSFRRFTFLRARWNRPFKIGDRIIVDKLAVEFGTIHTGDILVFKAPKAVATVCGDDVADLVKRVIGVPGRSCEVGGKQNLREG
jgi:hypothetical protein